MNLKKQHNVTKRFVVKSTKFDNLNALENNFFFDVVRAQGKNETIPIFAKKIKKKRIPLLRVLLHNNNEMFS